MLSARLRDSVADWVAVIFKHMLTPQLMVAVSGLLVIFNQYLLSDI